MLLDAYYAPGFADSGFYFEILFEGICDEGTQIFELLTK
jgi:hypothetical protein